MCATCLAVTCLRARPCMGQGALLIASQTPMMGLGALLPCLRRRVRRTCMPLRVRRRVRRASVLMQPMLLAVHWYRRCYLTLNPKP
jgi:hypothetical protein